MTKCFQKSIRINAYRCFFAVVSASLSATTFGVTPQGGAKPVKFRRAVTYIQNIEKLSSKLPLEISAVERTLAIPEENVQTRMLNPKRNPFVEPLQLTVSPEDDKILALAGKIAAPGKKLALAHFLRENMAQGEVVPGSTLKLVNITPGSMNLINRSELDELFAKDHYELSVATKNLQKNTRLRDQFIAQLRPYIPTLQISGILKKIQKGERLNVDSELLPRFARDSIKRHTVFKGPNCFHAALSFQSPFFSSSPQVNVREEPGYNREMINYDELWRVVQLNFYEIDPVKSDLQYGDMVLFFDTPKTPVASVDFHTLRHASTYLFGGYAFAKGSKSANSPYLIRPLADEWSTWTHFTENLGVKVFRRNMKHVKTGALWDPQDWMY